VPAVLGETLNSDLKSRLVRMAENDESTRLNFEPSEYSVQNGADLNGLKMKAVKLGDIWRSEEVIMVSTDVNCRALFIGK